MANLTFRSILARGREMSRNYFLISLRVAVTALGCGWMATVLPSTVLALGVINEVDIIVNPGLGGGWIDVNEDGAIDVLDDLDNVVLTYNDAALIQVDIIDGRVDVNQDGAIDGLDDLLDVDLNDRTSGLTQNSGTRGRNQVDVIDGRVDVDENGAIDNSDTQGNIQLLH
jgi:hypothetical protein